MMGLKLFYDNGIIHHDMKAGNIVYLEETNRLNFIDFGLMISKADLIKTNKENDNWLAVAHWSFPLELQYIQKKDFEKFSKETPTMKQKKFVKFIKELNSAADTKLTSAIRTFYSSVNKKSSVFGLKNTNAFFQDYILTLKDIDDKKKYDSFVEHSVNTIDSFGVASGLMETLCSLYNFMDIEFVKALADIFYKMFTPHLSSRLDINTVLPMYEECLEKYILKSRKQQFNDHKIISETKMETVFDKNLDSLKLQNIVIKSKKTLRKMAVSPKCPEGKELNHLTRRCVYNCKQGYVRDIDFKCRRKTLKRVDCPEGKVLNPKTNRCIKKQNTRKKICPEGKELNTKTNRCIKIKQPYYRRRNKTQSSQ